MATASATPVLADTAQDTPIRIEMTIEVAGGDDSDVADPKKLKESGLPMIPDKPTATHRDPLAPAAADNRAETPRQAAPAQATGPETHKVEAVGYTIYVRLDTGAAIAHDSDASGRNGDHQTSRVGNAAFLGGGIGFNVDPNVRLEGALTHRSSMNVTGTDGAGNGVAGDVKTTDAMVNVYYDFPGAGEMVGVAGLTPYIGAGVGVAAVSTDDLSTSGGASEGGRTAYNMAYALMAGVATQVVDRVMLDIGYRFVNLGEFEQNGSFSDGTTAARTGYDDLLVHEVRAGLRFSF